MEQIYILKDCQDFEPVHIFECGQCFRWNKNNDGSYTGVFENNVLNVAKKENSVIFKGICEGNIKDVCEKYFDLTRNYSVIKNKLANIDTYMKTSIEYGYGIRILNQDLWETVISFIISANNNIPRIKGIIEGMARKYGKEILWNGEAFYTFPKPNELANASVDDLRKLGLGFRDKRVYDTTQIFLNNKNLSSILLKLNFKDLRDKLIEFPGVGPKVADCILLFSSLKRLEAFPIDVWVKRVMQELYFNGSEEINNREIEKYAKEKYGDIAGLAQQYLFYWRRNL